MTFTWLQKTTTSGHDFRFRNGADAWRLGAAGPGAKHHVDGRHPQPFTQAAVRDTGLSRPFAEVRDSMQGHGRRVTFLTDWATLDRAWRERQKPLSKEP